jgi:hypothetical protein
VFLVLLSLLPVTNWNGEMHPARQKRNCGQTNASTLTCWLPSAQQQVAVAMSPAGLHNQLTNQPFKATSHTFHPHSMHTKPQN